MSMTDFGLIPDYRMVNVLYTGSRTQVYRAIRKSDQRSVILKVLNTPQPSFDERLKFRNQYAIGQRLNHPGLVRMEAMISYGNTQALVMEDCEGISLAEYLKQITTLQNGTAKRQGLPLTEVLAMAIQLAEILDYLGQQRVIHKDIKPANILIHLPHQRVKLIDFSIASQLPSETQALKNPNVLEGTLAYLSPEQTGRMNRGIDYRSDFYSLGVTLYRLLTGQLPFQSDDPLELVHCHLAKEPPSITDLNPKVPDAVVAIVDKLMAKTAEARYQSAAGLKADLETCLHQWKDTGEIVPFVLGQLDEITQFSIPQKLYGREQPLQELLAAFERVNHGEFEVVVIGGYSGVGKTALVREILPHLTQKRGHLGSGKFDQLQRNMPLDAPIQTLRSTVQQLLTSSPKTLVYWRDRFLNALGGNGQLIIDVIPELELIIGPQPAVPPLDNAAAANRFGNTFNQFAAALSESDHPYICFVDDWQWADIASLESFKSFATDPRCAAYSLPILAYRENEVDATHPFMQMLASIRQAGVKITEIHLPPLGLSDVTQLVADTLHQSPERVTPLVALLFQKTNGNPFFLNQLLKSLHSEGLIHFSFDLRQWQWDLQAIQQADITDNVVTLMVGKLNQLPELTRHLLTLAACVGNQFDLETLATIAAHSPQATAQALEEGLQVGLVVPLGDDYKGFLNQSTTQELSELDASRCCYRFLHDRVQQAAYALIPDDRKASTHYTIGQLLLQTAASIEDAKGIYELVNHLNRGRTLIVDPAERDQLACLNLKACRRAKAAIAYKTALEYGNIGLSLLGPEAWQCQYQTTLVLHQTLAEVTSLCGEFNQMDRLIERVLQQAQDPLDIVPVSLVKIGMLTAQNEFLDAIATAQSCLCALGHELPETPTPADIQQMMAAVHAAIGDRPIAELADLAPMGDPKQLAILQILAKIMPPCYMSGSPLFPLITALQVKLSIEYGNSPVSAHSYSVYAILAHRFLQSIPLAQQFSQLASHLTTKSANQSFKPEVCVGVGRFTHHLTHPLQETLSILETGYQASLALGKLDMAGFSLNFLCSNAYWSGQSLTELGPQIAAYHQRLLDLNQQQNADNCLIHLETVLTLLGNPEQVELLLEDEAAEAELVAQSLVVNDRQQLHFFYLCRLSLRFLLGNLKQALVDAQKARQYLEGGAGSTTEVALYFYEALAQLADSSNTDFKQIQDNQAKLKAWAKHAPMNYLHKWQLVEAELSRVQGDWLAAMDLYDLAISGATENDYVQDAAIANERAAEFYFSRHKPKIASVYLNDAYQGYEQWGAVAKLKQMETQYPWLNQARTPQPIDNSTAIAAKESTTQKSSSTMGELLDLATVLKAAEAISSEIVLERLLEKLLHLVLENAGAQKGCVVLAQDDDLIVEVVDVDLAKQQVERRATSVDASAEIPKSIIHYVARTREPLVINDVTQDTMFQADPYVQEQQPKSVLCVPMIHQAQLVGLIYLENSWGTRAFTPDRIEVLNLLCTQAAIALQNAQLFRQSQASQQQLSNVLANMPGMAYSCLKDDKWTMQYVSEGCLELTGYPVAALSKNAAISYVDLIHPDDEPWVVSEVAQALQEKRPFRRTYRIRTASGQEKWVWEQGRATWGEDNQVMIEGFITDISDRKAAEASLEQTQLKLIQHEKMSALGNLVAGVAHEINNPVGFLKGNIKPAQDYVSDLLGLIDLFVEKTPQLDPDVEAEIDAIDLDFIRQDLPELLGSMDLGVERIKNISTSLRTFSRADKDYKTTFNLHEGLDSTLLILKHRLKANENRPEIEIIKHYGDLPAIECFAGQLNQVFMNIVANAIDALDEANHGKSFAEIQANPNQITITTAQTVESHQVTIAIRDNGVGMPKMIKQRIFDHLYTTKGVGKGTGLGLAIAQQIIVDKHGGEINVNSIPTEGTEFLITLPIQAN